MNVYILKSTMEVWLLIITIRKISLTIVSLFKFVAEAHSTLNFDVLHVDVATRERLIRNEITHVFIA